MASEYYPKEQLKNVAGIIMGQSPPGSTYNEDGNGLPFFQGVRDFNYRHPSVRVFCSAPSRVAQPGDIFLSVRAPIGRVNIADRVCCIGRGLSIVRAKSDLDQRFIEFVLRLLEPSWQRVEGGGSVFGNATKNDLDSLQIPWPKPVERQAIAHVLGTLDDRIELNRRMNEALEGMAQALFKSWFVDFDPVIDNAIASKNVIPDEFFEKGKVKRVNGEIQRVKSKVEMVNNKKDASPFNPYTSHFPSEFTYSDEMGWIPMGWEMKPFGALIKTTIGGDWGKEKEDEKHTVKSTIIRGTDIPHLKSGSLSDAPSRWVEAKKLKTRQLDDGDIVIEVSGGSPKQPTGRALYLTHNLIDRLGCTVEPASFCRKLRPNTKSEGLFAAIHLERIYALGKMWEYQNQSTGISNFQTKIFMSSEMVVVPKRPDILNYFYAKVRPLMDKATLNQQIALAKLRDTLLPKLLSGQLRIPDGEKL